MLQKIKHKTTQIKQDRHDQVASFKEKVKEHRDQKFPHVHREIDDAELELIEKTEDETHPFSTRRMIIFRGVGLLFVGIWYILYHTLTYFYMLIFAYILSLALEGVIRFWARTTRSRGIGIFLAYFFLILFLLSGFIIIVPFLISRGTQMLQSVITYAQSIQTDILTQGIDAYVKGLKWIPDFLNDDILKYIKESDSASLLQTITENLGNIVNLSSSYLKTIGGYAVNIFGGIFATAGKLVIAFTLSLFFSISHFEVKYGIKYLCRKIKKSKEKVEEVYSGISSRLRSQLFLCLLIGIASYLGLRILSRAGYDLPQKGVLALIAGLFEIIPYLWPWLWAFPAAVFALLLHGFPGFLGVIIIYTIIQQSEEKLFVPVLMSKTLGVNPLLVFICMLFGGMLMGVFGVVLAVPIAVIFSIVFPIPGGKDKTECIIKSSDPIKKPLRKKK